MKKEIMFIILLVFVVVVLVLGMKSPSGSFEESDAKKFVLEDLKSRFPHADKIELINTSLMTNEDAKKYYIIKARVSEGLNTPCPTRTHYYYNYPEQNFVPTPPEYIVKNCKICEETPCIIGVEEEAIIASHTLLGTTAIQEYINTAPYAVPEVHKSTGIWTVLWTSSLNYSYSIEISERGSVISIKKIENNYTASS